MFDIFEQPWTLVGIAVLVLFGLLTFRSILPEKRRWWQWLLPVFITTMAFGTDYLVKTDREKIVDVINAGIKAVENEDYHAIEVLLTDNYSDSYHNSKESLISHCRRQLSQNLISKSKKTNQLITISGLKATAAVFLFITFEKDSYISQNYKSFLEIQGEVHFQKQPDKKWLITRVEVRKLDRQQVDWNRIR